MLERWFVLPALLLFLATSVALAQVSSSAPPAARSTASLPADAPARLPGPIGFTPGSRAAEAKAEAVALAVPTPDRARAWLRALTEEPHPAGSPADYKTALLVRDRLREWGWQAELSEYEVLLNTPEPRGHGGRMTPFLRLVLPEPKELSLREAPHALDKDSADSEAFPAFHGYGVSGDVTGQVVYANYGTPEDFAALERMGVYVKDRIVLVRYGAIFRGLKVRNAQKRGARGILIFSDPGDDGFAKGDVYPTGPYRPGSSLQRGSVQFLSLGPGDPSTPEGPSIKGCKRLPWDSINGFTLLESPLRQDRLTQSADRPLSIAAWEKATGLKREDYFATIPSLPIGYDAARAILEALGGPNVPTGWQGGLPLPYHVGPGPAVVHFAVDMKYELKTIWNVIATIRGTVEPERWVILCNHRDAWVYGAVDPSSGTAAMLETCRAIGGAVKSGWSPRRTLVFASWDAEEYGLVGSTEWADEHGKEIDARAAFLLNVDSAVSGPDVDLDGVPSLRDMLLDACDSVLDYRSGRTLRDVWTEKRRASWASTAPVEFFDPLWAALTTPAVDGQPGGTISSSPAESDKPRFSPQLNPLGSGSDYTAFLDHLGVPALDVGFTGRYGVYHSIYDDFFWMEKFGDPEFMTHATAARLCTVIAMRAAASEVLPFRFTAYGEALREHVDDLRRMIERKVRAVAPGSSPPPLSGESLRSLMLAVRRFQAAAAALDRATAELAARDGIDPGQLARLNDTLQRVERAFLLPDGLPGRPWFKHAVYAPGLTTGYACWPLPAVRQAVQENDARQLATQSAATATRIDAATTALQAATAAALVATPPRPAQTAAPATTQPLPR